MSDSSARDIPAPPPVAARVWASLNRASVGVTLGFAIVVAILLSPSFVTPFPVLLARTLFVATLLLLVFAATQAIPERRLARWMPRWLLTTLAVAIAAPLGTLAVYLVSVGGRIDALFGHEGRLTGFVMISATALGLGLLVTLAAQVREREARARALTLELELQRSRLERQAADARLATLQRQIEPHFLFNTLANVQALVESGSPRAAEVLASLIAYLRAAMPRLHEGESTVGQELALVRAYLELMRMRMPDRLGFTVQVEPALLASPLPSMSLLTLVENAVRHGLDPSERGGQVEIGGDRQAGVTRLWVADNGIGLADHASPGTGLANLRARLQGFFGGRAELCLSEVQPHGLRAEIVITE